MTSVCSRPAPLACLVIRKPLRFWPRARNQAKTRQGPSFAQQKFFAPCPKSLVLCERGGAKEGEGGRPDRRGVCAMNSGWLDEPPCYERDFEPMAVGPSEAARLIANMTRACSHWPLQEIVAVRGIGKVVLRDCGSMPTRQHNQRRSPLLHRLAREHKGAWHHSPSSREPYRPGWSRGANGLSLPAALSCERLFLVIRSQARAPLIRRGRRIRSSFSLMQPLMSISLDMRGCI